MDQNSLTTQLYQRPFCYTNQLNIDPVVNSSTGSVSFEWQDGSTANKHTARSSGICSLVFQDDCAQKLFEWISRLIEK